MTEDVPSREEFRRENLQQWATRLEEIFPIEIPDSAHWEDLNAIIRVLNHIGEDELGHLFFPTGGGLKLRGAAKAGGESECIDLFFGASDYILKPASLTFECPSDDLQWAYFRLEADALLPTGVYEDEYYERHIHEVVSRFGAGDYRKQEYYERGYYFNEHGNEVEIPEGTTRATRYLEPCSFVIFAESSLYNRDPSTYDARHNEMNAKDFRTYIEKNAADD